MVVIVWLLDLQLPMPSVPITTDVSSNPAHGKVYSIQQYVIKFVSDLRQVGGVSDTFLIFKKSVKVENVHVYT